MKLKLIQNLLLVIAAVVLISSCENAHPGFEKNENGIYYKIISSDEGASQIKCDSGMFWKMGFSYGTLDSLLFDFAANPNYFEMPFGKPEYKGDINEAFALLSAGDSAHIIIKADSFFLKTARQQEVPEIFKENNDLHFFVKMDDIVTTEQLNAQRDEELASRKALELADLTVYLSENYPELDPTPSGLFLIKEKSGKGKLPKDGDILNFDFSVTVLNGAELYNSVQAGRPGETEKGKPFDTEGFTEGLNTMKTGDEITIIVPSKLAFKDQGRQGMIEPYSTLIYWIKLNSFQSKAQHEKELAKKKAEAEKEEMSLMSKEKETIANYLKANNITVAPTESGLYYIETGAGTGEQPVDGDKVKVHYHGTLLDGTKFDSSYDRDAPYEFTLGKGQVIKGWDLGIAMMKVGGKATLIVPSDIAYGARARGGVIHAYAPLKFDVELIEITKGE